MTLTKLEIKIVEYFIRLCLRRKFKVVEAKKVDNDIEFSYCHIRADGSLNTEIKNNFILELFRGNCVAFGIIYFRTIIL